MFHNMNKIIDYMISKLYSPEKEGVHLMNALHNGILARGQYCISRDHMTLHQYRSLVIVTL